MDFPGGVDGKVAAYNVGDPGSIPGLGRSPGEGNGNPFQCSCLEKSHGWRNLVGYSLLGCKELDTTEWLHFQFLSWLSEGFPGGTNGKEPACQCWRHKRHGFHHWVRKIPWSRKWHHTLQYPCLENSMDRATWQAIVHGIAKSWTQLSTWHTWLWEALG